MAVLEQDPYSHYGSGSRGAISIQIHMDPDLKHCISRVVFGAGRPIIEPLDSACVWLFSGSHLCEDLPVAVTSFRPEKLVIVNSSQLEFAAVCFIPVIRVFLFFFSVADPDPH